MLPWFTAWADFGRVDLSEDSFKQYKYWLLRFWADTEIEPPAATLSDLNAWLATFGPRGDARSLAIRAVRHLFKFLIADGQRTDNPTIGLPRTRKRRRIPDHLTVEELCRLVYAAAMRDPEWAWSLVLVYATGARIGEACNLRAKDFDFDHRTVTIRSTKTGMDRIVHLNPASEAAARWLLSRNGTATVLGVSTAAMRCRMAKVAQLAGLPQGKAHPHALRHSAGTHLSEGGADQAEIMAFLGHVDPSMTAVYVHVTSPRAKRTARILR